MGMSCERPLGSERLIDIGRASLASSIIAKAIDSLTLSSIGTKAGAPIASWRDPGTDDSGLFEPGELLRAYENLETFLRGSFCLSFVLRSCYRDQE